MGKRKMPTVAGAITSYVHLNGRIGVLVEVTCNSAFVARSEEFQQLTRDIALQIAAMNPKFIRKLDVPAEADQQQSIAELCLYEQPFIKDNSLTVGQLIIGCEMRLREHIAVTRFVRFGLGDSETQFARSGRERQPPGDEDSCGVTAPVPKRPKGGSGATHADLDAESGHE